MKASLTGAFYGLLETIAISLLIFPLFHVFGSTNLPLFVYILPSFLMGMSTSASVLWIFSGVDQRMLEDSRQGLGCIIRSIVSTLLPHCGLFVAFWGVAILGMLLALDSNEGREIYFWSIYILVLGAINLVLIKKVASLRDTGDVPKLASKPLFLWGVLSCLMGAFVLVEFHSVLEPSVMFVALITYFFGYFLYYFLRKSFKVRLNFLTHK